MLQKVVNLYRWGKDVPGVVEFALDPLNDGACITSCDCHLLLGIFFHLRLHFCPLHFPSTMAAKALMSALADAALSVPGLYLVVRAFALPSLPLSSNRWP